MDYWAKPGRDRRQIQMFCPTLDDHIGQDHPVRHLDEILRKLDWSPGPEGRIHFDRGDAIRRSRPIHPFAYEVTR